MLGQPHSVEQREGGHGKLTHPAAIQTSLTPATLADLINTEREHAATKTELDRITEPDTMTAAEIHTMIDSPGDLSMTKRPARQTAETGSTPGNARTAYQ